MTQTIKVIDLDVSQEVDSNIHDSSKQTNNQVNYSSKDSELVQSALFNKSHSIIQKEENVKRESKRFNTSQKKISLDIFEYEDRKGKAL